jgi:hypothetical protein
MLTAMLHLQSVARAHWQYTLHGKLPSVQRTHCMRRPCTAGCIAARLLCAAHGKLGMQCSSAGVGLRMQLTVRIDCKCRGVANCSAPAAAEVVGLEHKQGADVLLHIMGIMFCCGGMHGLQQYYICKQNFCCHSILLAAAWLCWLLRQHSCHNLLR